MRRFDIDSDNEIFIDDGGEPSVEIEPKVDDPFFTKLDLFTQAIVGNSPSLTKVSILFNQADDLKKLRETFAKNCFIEDVYIMLTCTNQAKLDIAIAILNDNYTIKNIFFEKILRVPLDRITVQGDYLNGRKAKCVEWLNRNRTIDPLKRYEPILRSIHQKFITSIKKDIRNGDDQALVFFSNVDSHDKLERAYQETLDKLVEDCAKVRAEVSLITDGYAGDLSVIPKSLSEELKASSEWLTDIELQKTELVAQQYKYLQSREPHRMVQDESDFRDKFFVYINRKEVVCIRQHEWLNQNFGTFSQFLKKNNLSLRMSTDVVLHDAELSQASDVPLTVAVKSKQHDIFRKLLQLGADIFNSVNGRRVFEAILAISNSQERNLFVESLFEALQSRCLEELHCHEAIPRLHRERSSLEDLKNAINKQIEIEKLKLKTVPSFADRVLEALCGTSYQRVFKYCLNLYQLLETVGSDFDRCLYRQNWRHSRFSAEDYQVKAILKGLRDARRMCRLEDHNKKLHPSKYDEVKAQIEANNKTLQRNRDDVLRALAQIKMCILSVSQIISTKNFDRGSESLLLELSLNGIISNFQGIRKEIISHQLRDELSPNLIELTNLISCMMKKFLDMELEAPSEIIAEMNRVREAFNLTPPLAISEHRQFVAGLPSPSVQVERTNPEQIHYHTLFSPSTHPLQLSLRSRQGFTP